MGRYSEGGFTAADFSNDDETPKVAEPGTVKRKPGSFAARFGELAGPEGIKKLAEQHPSLIAKLVVETAGPANVSALADEISKVLQGKDMLTIIGAIATLYAGTATQILASEDEDDEGLTLFTGIFMQMVVAGVLLPSLEPDRVTAVRQLKAAALEAAGKPLN